MYVEWDMGTKYCTIRAANKNTKELYNNVKKNRRKIMKENLGKQHELSYFLILARGVWA